MSKYHKIQSIYKRDMSTNQKKLIEGDWTLPEFKYLRNNIWQFTEKVDGTNIRVIYKNGVVTFGGRTDNAQIPARLVERLNELFLPIATKMLEIFGASDVVFYGEGYGAKIQKIGEKYNSDQDFILFDVRIGNFWLQRSDVEDLGKKLGINVVPVIGQGTLNDAVAWAKRGIRSTWGHFQAEGIVARPKIELMTRGDKRIIAKIKCCDFF